MSRDENQRKHSGSLGGGQMAAGDGLKKPQLS